jgi:photosystem II stability/assembly factor-like uncharacterized protein
MSGVRVLVGTRKGAFILTADGRRRSWDICGPHFAGWEVFHLNASPADPGRLYASQSSSWFGQVMQRSDDGGRSWNAVGNQFQYLGEPGTHLWYDGSTRPFEFKRIWQLAPSPDDPDTVYAGAEDAALFRTTDGGANWQELPALRTHVTAPGWMPGAGGSWSTITKGLVSQHIPDPTAEVGHCVHKIARHPANPDRLYMQLHWDVYRSDDGGANWYVIRGNLPGTFGFPIDVHAHEPDTVYVVPITSDSEHFPHGGALQVWRSRSGGHEWEPLTRGLPQQHCYVNVLREAMAVDRLDPCGVYFGTTGGQVYGSADGGDSWQPLVRDLPAVLSVEVQTLA